MPTYSNAIAGVDFTSNKFLDLGNMIGKVAFQVIRNTNAKNHLSMFAKVLPMNGDTIEQAVVKMCEKQVYNREGTDALKRWPNNVVVKYFKDWTRLKYPVSIDYEDIAKVLLTGKGTEEIASKIVASTGEGDTQDHYEFVRDMFKSARLTADNGGELANTLVKVKEILLKENKIDYDEILTTLKNTISGMSFVNADFNSAKIKKGTRLNDIMILMPYKLKNKMDVESLAGVFNLEKAEVKNKIITIDTENENGYDYIYVVDKNAVLDYTRLYAMMPQPNADALFFNYTLHTERLYGISPLFDGCYIKIQTSSEKK